MQGSNAKVPSPTITETLRRLADDAVAVGSSSFWYESRLESLHIRCDPQTVLALVAAVEAAREMRNAERNHAASAVVIQATRDLDAALEALAGVEG